MDGRKAERKMIERARAGKQAYPVHYEYHRELFSVRQKLFWPLSSAKKLLQDLIPTLSHESDGLIFQVPHIRGCPC